MPVTRESETPVAPVLECRDCHIALPPTAMNYQIGENNERVCETCRRAYRSCADCGSLEHRETLDDNDDYCRSCSNRDDIKFRDYHTSGIFLGKEEGKTIKSLRPFGIELEVIYTSSTKAAKFSHAIAKEVGITTDGSIQGAGIELQTPPASGSTGEKLIEDICKELIKNQFKVNRSCGYHLHLDVKEIDDKPANYQLVILQDLWLFYIAFEDVLLSFLPKSRKTGNTYCKSLKNDYNYTEIANAENTDKLEKIWYRARTNEQLNNAKADSKHGTRYRGINLHTLFSARHIEIRYHSGTINPRKVLEWVNLHTAIVDIVFQHNGIHRQWLSNMSSGTDITEKTKEFFNFLGKKLSKTNKDYFLKRQKTFMTAPVYDINPEEEKVVEDLLKSEEEI